MYMAPEVLQGIYDEKCDLWSIWIITYILIAGYPPFNSRNTTELKLLIEKAPLRFPEEEWGSASTEVKDFINKLLNRDSKKRLSAEDAIQHPWIQERKKGFGDRKRAISVMKNMQSYRADRKLQQAVWQFYVSALSSKDEQGDLLRTFQTLDVNGDGQLTREELIIGYKKLMPELDAEKEVDRILDIVDSNHSGVIDYSEFVTACISRSQLLTKEKLESAFKLFDKDSSGSISIEEFKEVLTGGGNLVSEEVWKQLVSEVDPNGDGQISLEEFKEMMLKLLL